MTDRMKFILQSNVYSEDGWDALVDALERNGLPYSIHKVVPFMDGQAERLDRGFLTTDPLDPPPDVPEGGRAIVLGSYTLAHYAARKKWVPGAFLDNLDQQEQIRQWPGRMLNGRCSVSIALGDVSEELARTMAAPHETFFVRPIEDTKSFVGHVTDWPTFSAWRDRVLALLPEDNPTITGATRLLLGETREIYGEWRTWVIPKRRKHHASAVVTTSQYKIGSRKTYRPPEMTDQRIIDFVDECVDEWYPNEAFVLDVFDTPEGLAIGEVNNINSAGYYLGNVGKLACELEEHFG